MVKEKMCGQKSVVKQNLWSKNMCGQRKNQCSQKKSAVKENVWSKKTCAQKKMCGQKYVLKKPVVKEYVRSNLRSKNQCPSNLPSLALPKMWSTKEKKCGQNSALPKNVWSKKIINNSPHKKGITTLPFPNRNSLTQLALNQLSVYHLFWLSVHVFPKTTKNRCFSKNSDFSGRARKKIIFSLAPEFLPFL